MREIDERYDRAIAERDAARAELAKTLTAQREALDERNAALAAVRLLREALDVLWRHIQVSYGDWYMRSEKRAHANRVDNALAATVEFADKPGGV